VSKAHPGWVLYSEANRQLRQHSLMRFGDRMLQAASKRRFQTSPGKRRRRYWYIRQKDFDHMVQEARALSVEHALGVW